MDKRGKLSKFSYKERYNFTIDEELMRKSRDYCKGKNIKMPNKIEELRRRGIKEI